MSWMTHSWMSQATHMTTSSKSLHTMIQPVHSCVWHDWVMHVWHDSLMQHIWLRRRIYCNTMHDTAVLSSTDVAWHIHVCDMTHTMFWMSKITYFSHFTHGWGVSYAWMRRVIPVTTSSKSLHTMIQPVHSCVWHDSVRCGYHVWHDSFMQHIWLRRRSHCTPWYSQYTHVCDMTQSCMFTCVTWLIHATRMTTSCKSLQYHAWYSSTLLHRREMTHSHVWHDVHEYVQQCADLIVLLVATNQSQTVGTNQSQTCSPPATNMGMWAAHITFVTPSHKGKKNTFLPFW